MRKNDSVEAKWISHIAEHASCSLQKWCHCAWTNVLHVLGMRSSHVPKLWMEVLGCFKKFQDCPSVTDQGKSEALSCRVEWNLRNLWKPCATMFTMCVKPPQQGWFVQGWYNISDGRSQRWQTTTFPPYLTHASTCSSHFWRMGLTRYSTSFTTRFTPPRWGILCCFVPVFLQS